MREIKHFVYILKCGDGTYYTGYTTDVKRRLELHQMGKGAKYTRGRAPLELIFTQEFASKREALQSEYRIKQLNQSDKKRLIHFDPVGGPSFR